MFHLLLMQIEDQTQANKMPYLQMTSGQVWQDKINLGFGSLYVITFFLTK